MYKIVDTDNWIRKSTFLWFNSFINPCYGITKRINVKKIYMKSKETGTSFFINFLYVITKSLNSIDSFRLRIVKDEVRLYETINPAFTVMTSLGTFDNAGFEMTDDYSEFYKRAKAEIDELKNEKKIRDGYNDSLLFNEYYITCVPWIDFESVTHPIPLGDKESCSVPRIAFSKFDKDFNLSLNITVSHSLVDGKELSDGFIAIENMIENENDFIR